MAILLRLGYLQYYNLARSVVCKANMNKLFSSEINVLGIKVLSRDIYSTFKV